MNRWRGYILIVVAILMVLPSHAAIFIVSGPGNWSDGGLWLPSYPGNSIDAGDTVYVANTVTMDVNVSINGVLFLNDPTDTLISTNKDITIESTGTLINVGVLSMGPNEIHIDGLLDNSGECTVADIHNDGDICNSGTLTVTTQLKMHGGTLRCGGTVEACDINMSENGGTKAYIENSNLCCSGVAPVFSDETEDIDSTTVSICGNILLPVTFTNFQIHEIDQSYELTWDIMSEWNVESYLIKRGAEGSPLIQIFEEPAVSPSSEFYTYHLTDHSPFSGTSYYQVVSLDYDGTMVESPILEITSKFIEEQSIKVYPNPGTGHNFHIWLGEDPIEKGKVRIYNLMGGLLYESKITSTNHLTMDLMLSEGLYLVKVLTDDFITTKRYLVK